MKVILKTVLVGLFGVGSGPLCAGPATSMVLVRGNIIQSSDSKHLIVQTGEDFLRIDRGALPPSQVKAVASSMDIALIVPRSAIINAWSIGEGEVQKMSKKASATEGAMAMGSRIVVWGKVQATFEEKTAVVEANGIAYQIDIEKMNSRVKGQLHRIASTQTVFLSPDQILATWPTSVATMPTQEAVQQPAMETMDRVWVSAFYPSSWTKYEN